MCLSTKSGTTPSSVAPLLVYCLLFIIYLFNQPQFFIFLFLLKQYLLEYSCIWWYCRYSRVIGISHDYVCNFLFPLDLLFYYYPGILVFCNSSLQYMDILSSYWVGTGVPVHVYGHITSVLTAGIISVLEYVLEYVACYTCIAIWP